MRVVRLMFLCALLVGVAATLVVGVQSAHVALTAGPYGSGGPTGIGNDTVPPRVLFLAAAHTSGFGLWWLVGLLIALAILAGVGTAFLLRRRSA